MPPAHLDLAPASSMSSASLGLTVGASSGAEFGIAANVVQTNPAAEVHPHDWHPPEALLDAGPLVLTAAGVALGAAVRQRFRFHVGPI